MSENTYADALEGVRKSIQALGRAVQTVVSTSIFHFPKIFKVLEGISIFSTWFSAVETLVDNQYVFTDKITNTFVDDILATESIDNLIDAYYLDCNSKRLNALIDRCRSAIETTNNIDLYNQSIFAYENGYYQIACVGLFAVLDGLFSQVSDNTTTGFKNRMEKIQDKINKRIPLSEMDNRIIVIYYALENFDKSIFANSHFDEKEPPTVNRHWTLHGRSTRKYLLSDFIKVLLWVEALIIMDNYEE